MKRKINMPDVMDDDCRRLTRAFTVHPGWAWAIMKGAKKQEWRTFLPHPAEGVCAIHVSKSYCKAQWEFEAKQVSKLWTMDPELAKQVQKGVE